MSKVGTVDDGIMYISKSMKACSASAHRVDREARPSTPTSVRPHDLVTVAEPTCAQATIYARDQDRVKTGDPLCNRSGKVAHAPGAVATEYGGLAWCVVVQHVDAVYGPIA